MFKMSSLIYLLLYLNQCLQETDNPLSGNYDDPQWRHIICVKHFRKYCVGVFRKPFRLIFNKQKNIIDYKNTTFIK